MSDSDPHRPRARRRVQLPGGRVIEVVLLRDDATAVPAAAPAAVPEAPRDLHVCPDCHGRFVHPVDWAEAGPDHWDVELRCPDCLHTEIGIFTQEEVERFDSELDRGTEVLVRDLQSLAHANMAEQVELFVRALAHDQVLPGDF